MNPLKEYIRIQIRFFLIMIMVVMEIIAIMAEIVGQMINRL
jgi:hypothetical protein